ncbi:hypothetical protein [Streptomyces griseorubiginosus]|uniref:hypothetical protein n=1 Tax=Streptomyces griseorubiginosus TaxID=67304 RepID=UPI00131BB91A|nr:hypothetical protein [Streptomyces griseorubiginosus]
MRSTEIDVQVRVVRLGHKVELVAGVLAEVAHGLDARSLCDMEMEEVRGQRDVALAASRQAETAVQALRRTAG